MTYLRWIVGIATLALAFVAQPLLAEAPLPTGRWQNYPHAAIGSPALPNAASISTIAIDNEEHIWIGTFAHGIAMFDGYTWTRYTTSNGLVDNHVRRITVIGSGIWIATADGVSLLAPASGTFTNYTAAGTSPNGLPDDYVYAIAENRASGPGPVIGLSTYLFATRGDGVADCSLLFPNDLDCSYYTKSNTSNGLASDFVYDVERAANGNLWYATGGGVSRQSGNTWTAFTSAANTPGCADISQSSDIAIDRVHNRVWVALANREFDIDGGPGSGACMYDVLANKWFAFNASNSGLMDETVSDLAVDSDGRAWFATNPYNGGDPGGVYVCTWVDGPLANDDTCYWQIYKPIDGLGSIDVNAVAVGLDRVWFGTQNAAISSFALRWASLSDEAKVLAALPNMLYAGSSAGVKRFDYTEAIWTTMLPNLDITALLALASDDIWAATATNGLRHWNGSNWQTTTAQDRRLASNNLLALAQDTLGRIWIGTSDAGVSVFDPAANAWTTFDTVSVLPSNLVQSLAADTSGGMWVGTETGLIHYTGVIWENVAQTSLPAANIQALLLDGAGNLWAATAAGLARHTTGVWTTFTTANGLRDNNVITLGRSAGGQLWAGTAAGASRFDGTQWQTYRRVNSGLENERVQALVEDADGNLWTSGAAYSQSGVNVAAAILLRSGSDEPLGQPAPTITDFTPTSGLATAQLTINGNYFTPGMIVEFAGQGDFAQAFPSSVDTTAVRVRVPPNAMFGKIRIRNAVGTATSSANFSPLPQISTVEDDNGIIGSEVMIRGLNLASPGFTEVRFGNGAFQSLHVLAETHQLLRVRVPRDATSGPIQVRTPAGIATSPIDYTVSANGLVIFGYEVHQGLPQYPLIAGKSTVVRVFIGTSDPNGACAYVDRGVVQVLRQGDNTPHSFLANLANGGIKNAKFCNTTKDVSSAGSVNFVIPGEELQADEFYFMGFGLSIGFISYPSRDIGRYTFTATDDVRIHAAVPGWINDATQAAALDQSMVTQYRTYPVRDGWGQIGDPTGMQIVLRDYPLCDGTPTAYCGSGYAWDFLQENPAGQRRACTIENTMDNATDDGSRVVFTVNSLGAGAVDRRTFYARVRTGQTLPPDPVSLLSLAGQPAGVLVSATSSASLPTQRCGNTTIPDVIRYVLRFTNTTTTAVTARIEAEYDENVIDLYGSGGIMAVSGNTFASMLVPGRFWYGGGWLPSRHDAPADENNNGTIDNSDIANYLVEGEVWNTTTGQFVPTTNANLIQPGDLIRSYADTNRNNQHDGSEPKSSFVQRGANGQILLWNIPFAYMTDYNKSAAIKTQFSALLFMPGVNPYMGPGQGRCEKSGPYCVGPGTQLWTNVEDTTVFGQELGHSLGMVHKDSPNRNAGTHTVNGQITYIPAGYDTVGHNVVLGPNMFSIMWGTSQSPGSRGFFEPFEYYQVFHYLRSANQAHTASLDSGEVFYMAGTTDGEDSVTLDHSFVAQNIPTTPADPLSEFLLRFKDGTTYLGEHRFPVELDAYNEDHHNEIVSAPIGVYSVVAPYPAGAKSVEIWHGNHLLLTRAFSVASPTVQILSPNGGESIGGNAPLTVQWQASDPDSSTLRFTVRYSPDNGTTWHTLGVALMGNAFTIPASSLPGSSTALIEIEATDGFNTGNDRSNAVFSVGGKPPLGATILAPANGKTFIYGVPIVAAGSAFDLEDGLLSGGQLTWSSNLDGALGSGRTITPLLTVGVHHLLLTATDSNAAEVTTTVQITVDADFDGDGLGDAYEATVAGLEWWDSSDAGKDFDGDGLTNRAEAEFGTDPNKADTDGDEINDGDEALAGTLPLDGTNKPASIQLLVSRVALDYTVVEGTVPFDDSLFLMSSTAQTLTWTSSENAPWLTLTPATGATTGETALRIDPVGLKPGAYTGTLILTPDGAPAKALPLTLTVMPALSTDIHLYLPIVQSGAVPD